ncbi:hypothetical protein RR46_00164 [Papilio xuthus]|uniref:Uncharacterized protein n=1 Tax=Papilio xuthus TaxID=66420 RepID=A0A0N1PK81_PAPXU|nr:hypothetical protein RR46_08174 [Papilio xuthus]KPJ20767.1 hypothetical protein RR46_00164 [Papilio xuthus]
MLCGKGVVDSLQGLQARTAATAVRRHKARNMSVGVTGLSGGGGRRRRSYYRPRAAPLLRPRGQGDRTRPSSRIRGHRANDDTGRSCVTPLALAVWWSKVIGVVRSAFPPHPATPKIVFCAASRAKLRAVKISENVDNLGGFVGVCCEVSHNVSVEDRSKCAKAMDRPYIDNDEQPSPL